MRSARIIFFGVLALQTSALLSPSRPPRAAVRCDAKSKKKDKAPFKPPPLELSRPVMVLSRRESHEVVADAREREAVAARIGVEEVRSLEASVAVEKRGRDDVALLGELTATVAQKSVTTGDLVVSEVSAPLDVLVVVVVDGEDYDDDDRDVVATSDGVVDLGEIVVQTLSLEVDPYPGTGTASGAPVASYGDLDDSQPIIVDDSAYGDLDLR